MLSTIAVQAYARHKKLHRGSLRIYIQELPTTMNLVWPVMARDGQFKQNGIYVSSWAFFNKLLSDWSVRTEDPWEADLIFVPAFTCAPACDNPIPGFDSRQSGVTSPRRAVMLYGDVHVRSCGAGSSVATILATHGRMWSTQRSICSNTRRCGAEWMVRTTYSGAFARGSRRLVS